MDNRYSKIKPPIPLIVIGLVVGLGYVGFSLFEKIDSARALYLTKSKELISIEKKQEHITQLELELAKTSASREEVASALLAPAEALDFLVRIEDIARKAGLSYDVRILQEITQESIDEEQAALRRSRRKTSDVTEGPVEVRLPGITFSVTIEGSYLGIIRFFEGVASLPYYTRIESFTVSGKERPKESEPSEAEAERTVEAVVQLMVFTKK